MATVAEIDAQIKALEDQKKQLQQKAKDAALKKANDAIADLKALGYSYRLAENDTASRAPRAATGTRRAGIRDQVLAAVKAVPTGISRAKVLENLGAKGDKSSEQSISNALAALKKAGTLKLADGLYKA